MSGAGGLTADQLDRARADGYVVLAGYLGPRLAPLVDELAILFPSPEDYFAHPERHDDLRGGQFDSVRTVPTGRPMLDELPFADGFATIARQITGAERVRLLRAGYQAKYAGAADFEQVLHRDYGNHTLVVPTDSSIVGFFVYFTAVGAGDGPTMVVDRAAAAHLDAATTHLAPDLHPSTYAREHALLCDAGTLLVYDNLTFHRGSSLRGEAGHRVTLSFAYGADVPWHDFVAWANRSEEPAMATLVTSLTPTQRCLLGFPAPGDPYWTAATVDAVGARYPGMDMGPYRSALAAGQ